MNIWSLLGVSVAIVATFCIVMTEVFQDNRYYEAYRWHACGFLIVSGVFVWAIGSYILGKRKKQASEQAIPAQQEQPSGGEEDSEAAQEAGPFFLFSPLYWGPVLIIFGVIIVFIVPQYSLKKVVARTVEPVKKTNAPPPVVVSNPPVVVPVVKTPQFPDVKLQGIILRPSNPSVVINKKAFFVGDYVEDAEIVAIERNSITLQNSGQKKIIVFEK